MPIDVVNRLYDEPSIEIVGVWWHWKCYWYWYLGRAFDRFVLVSIWLAWMMVVGGDASMMIVGGVVVVSLPMDVENASLDAAENLLN